MSSCSIAVLKIFDSLVASDIVRKKVEWATASQKPLINTLKNRGPRTDP
jgi:hypothetical protein